MKKLKLVDREVNQEVSLDTIDLGKHLVYVKYSGEAYILSKVSIEEELFVFKNLGDFSGICGLHSTPRKAIEYVRRSGYEVKVFEYELS